MLLQNRITFKVQLILLKKALRSLSVRNRSATGDTGRIRFNTPAFGGLGVVGRCVRRLVSAGTSARISLGCDGSEEGFRVRLGMDREIAVRTGGGVWKRTELRRASDGRGGFRRDFSRPAMCFRYGPTGCGFAESEPIRNLVVYVYDLFLFSKGARGYYRFR